MTTLREILKEQQSYVKDSGFVVEVDYSLPTVTIAGSYEEIYLSEQQAQEFIDQATQLWEEAGDVGMNVALYAVAKPYVESLA